MNRLAILCVDDEQHILDSLKIELERVLDRTYAIAIELAQGGEEALEVLEELEEDEYEVALVISDYVMPGMKGDELLKRIHAISPKTLKIMLTGQATVEAVGSAVNEAKLYRYISKPWQSEDLSLTVSEALHRYLQEQKLAERHLQLQEVNQALEVANRKQIQLIAQLRDNEHRLQQFLDGVPVGTIVLDNRGMLYALNAKAKELMGKDRVPDATVTQFPGLYQLYRVDSEELYPSENLPSYRALQGESTRINDLEIRQEDRRIPIEVWGTPIYDTQGNIIYAIAAFQDITERQRAEAERQRLTQELLELNQANERFVPKQFLQLLDKKSIVEVEVGESVQQEMSILFANICHFSTLSENMTLDETFKFINSYLTQMEPAILEHQGFIDKYIGDTIMALFSHSADDAVRAGVDMLQRLAQYNTTRQRRDRLPIQIGIGINTGNLMLGTVGGRSRMDSTVISDAVNLASRMEGLTKTYGVSLLISHETFLRLSDPFEYDFRLVDRVAVKGKSNRVSVFEVFNADPPELRAGKLATKTQFEQALVNYYLQDWTAAAEGFSACLQHNPRDRAAKIYLQRTQKPQSPSTQNESERPWMSPQWQPVIVN
ncbi:adenylate/guanylate cyclase domain-containing protein [Lusitaniella coriacea]|uniref:adenylate/guanylate cyclase domain-containing protein n=1 Tax=Lusitaniella coriacea TaxID=1983105 RepID=UPI003CE894D0